MSWSWTNSPDSPLDLPPTGMGLTAFNLGQQEDLDEVFDNLIANSDRPLLHTAGDAAQPESATGQAGVSFDTVENDQSANSSTSQITPQLSSVLLAPPSVVVDSATPQAQHVQAQSGPDEDQITQEHSEPVIGAPAGVSAQASAGVNVDALQRSFPSLQVLPRAPVVQTLPFSPGSDDEDDPSDDDAIERVMNSGTNSRFFTSQSLSKIIMSKLPQQSEFETKPFRFNETLPSNTSSASRTARGSHSSALHERFSPYNATGRTPASRHASTTSFSTDNLHEHDTNAGSDMREPACAQTYMPELQTSPNSTGNDNLTNPNVVVGCDHFLPFIVRTVGNKRDSNYLRGIGMVNHVQETVRMHISCLTTIPRKSVRTPLKGEDVLHEALAEDSGMVSLFPTFTSWAKIMQNECVCGPARNGDTKLNINVSGSRPLPTLKVARVCPSDPTQGVFAFTCSQLRKCGSLPLPPDGSHYQMVSFFRAPRLSSAHWAQYMDKSTGVHQRFPLLGYFDVTIIHMLRYKIERQ